MNRVVCCCLLLIFVRLAAAQNATPAEADSSMAATNAVAAPAKSSSGANTAEDLWTYINSDHGTFSPTTNRAVYWGHVRVDNPKMKLTSKRLVADMQHGDKPDRHIVATTNVVIDFMAGTNQPWHATGDVGIYDFKVAGATTNETVTLTGHARAESIQYIVTGEPLIYDMQAHLFLITSNYSTTVKQTNSIPTGTNAFRSKTRGGPTNPE